jgi:hypothetical protein
MGHISGTWELLLCEYWRRSMIIIEKNTDLKRLTGRLKLRFLTEIGRLHWNQGEEVAHFAWFGEPWFNTNKTKNKYKDICKSERWYANKSKELNNYWIYQSFRKLKTLAWHSIRQAKKFPRPKNMTKIQDSFRFALCNIHVLLHNIQLFTIFKTFFFWQRKSHSHWIYCKCKTKTVLNFCHIFRSGKFFCLPDRMSGKGFQLSERLVYSVVV